MSDPLFIDVEMGVEPLLTLVRNQLRQVLHPCTAPFAIQGLGTVYLDHIDVPTATGFTDGSVPFASGFVRRAADLTTNTIAHGWKDFIGSGSTTTLTSVAVHDPEIVVPLRLAVATDYTLAQGLDPIATDGMIVRLVFAIHAEMKRDELDEDGNPRAPFPSLSVKVVEVDFGLLDGLLPDWAKSAIGSAVLGKSVPLPVNLSPLKGLMKGYVDLAETNVGVTLDVPGSSSQHATRVGVRFEVNGPAESLAAWQAYLDGAMGPSLADPSGCRFEVPAGLLTAWSESMFAAQLEAKAAADDAQFEVLDWPDSFWWPGLLQTSFEIDVFVPMCPLDVAVTVDVTTTFGIEGGNLTAVSTISHDANDADVVACAAMQGGPELLQAISVAIAADVYEPDMSSQVGLPAKCAWTVDDEEITCTYPIALPLGSVAATITQLQPSPDALAFVGVAAVSETQPTTPWFNPNPVLQWPGAGLCDDGPPFLELVLAKIGAGKVCAVEVVDDPVNQFTPFVQWSDKHSVVLRLTVSDIVGGTSPPLIGPSPGESQGKPTMPEGWYFANPYPLRVVIRTTDGAKLVESVNVLPIPPSPPELSPLEQAELAVQKKLNCQIWAEWWSDRLFLPRWWPDPPPESVRGGSIYEQLWRIVVSDVDAGREILVSGREGPLARLASGWGRFAFASLLLPADVAEEALEITEAGLRGSAIAGGALGVEQTLVEHVASVELPAAATETAIWAASPVRAACLTPVGVFIYDVSDPASPKLAEVLEDSEISGIRGVGAGLLVWGRRGLRVVGGGRAARQWRSTEQPVLDATVVRGRLRVVTENMATNAGDQLRLMPGIALLGTWDASRSDEERPGIPELPLDGVVAIQPADGPARRGEIVLLRHDGGSLRYDVSVPDTPRLTADIPVDRWSRTSRFRDIVIRTASGGTELQIHRRRSTVQLRRWQLAETGSRPIGATGDERT
jgi:hypothetical protein